MFDLSPIQLVLVLVIALFAIGPKRLPEVGRTIGRTMREVRGVISLDGEDHDDVDRQERTPARAEARPDDATPEPARSIAVGGEDLSASSPAPTDATETPDGVPPVAEGAPPEAGPSADDMVVRGRRDR